MSRPQPCPEYADALSEAVWGDRVNPGWETHLRECPRCREAWEEAQAFCQRVTATAEPVPDRARRGLAEEVFARTTRRVPARRAGWAWVGGAVAAAGAAFLVLRRQTPTALPEDPGIDFAGVDLEVLENLDLAENLDLLEVLDALEALDDAG